jgi:hypothetical protein
VISPESTSGQLAAELHPRHITTSTCSIKRQLYGDVRGSGGARRHAARDALRRPCICGQAPRASTIYAQGVATTKDIRRWAMASPEVEETSHFLFHVPAFNVRGRTFLGMGKGESSPGVSRRPSGWPGSTAGVSESQ